MAKPLSRTEISRVLSHALRHAPEEYALELDAEGWAPVTEVLSALHRLGPEWESVDKQVLVEVLEAAEKKRHQMSDGRIRAVHGHSVPVQPAQAPSTPPPVLFHGTAPAAVPQILAAGILPMRRQYVHLSDSVEQARQVGQRKDADPVILTVDTGVAVAQGTSFYRSDSGVWLAESVPASAVSVPGA
ncbi:MULTISPECIES: RNA 2'-phosphotransferase [unclassified Arthrobacter]|uniref:RNA 2'-phosphotransferase n=1 Tax=unclassified Arthrobacter TaxID=235627 RepID=UPI001D156158|nr:MULTISPECIES: RNA 2'-phosphotransferase [unclassified Arthrobacter]MCC3291132.1 RNA 2'-phosphotransferase [Arthrobacter sp. zg-Y1110]MCC3301466.1 RNA 2'-phosphotransferase [Arthrobacter sp. zg-Y895]UWX83568.1 RNA 2'-phosphotransferase [Arthrobacter sp. zg-Y1110]